MRKFDEDFRVALRQRVEAIEAESGVEIVATVMPRATRYWHVYLLWGIIPAMLVLTFMMFLEAEFWYVLIYLETIGALILGGALPWIFSDLVRLSVGKKGLRKEAENAARALFQRAGMVETRERIGILVVFAWFEKEVILIPDRGAEEMIPPDELETLDNRLSEVFSHPDPANAILEQLATMKNTLKLYIPRDIHDINELPDELWLH